MPKSVREKRAVSAFEFQFRASLTLTSLCNLALRGDVVLKRSHRGLLRFPEHRKSPPYWRAFGFHALSIFLCFFGGDCLVALPGDGCRRKAAVFPNRFILPKKNALGEGEGEHPLASAEGVPPPPTSTRRATNTTANSLFLPQAFPERRPDGQALLWPWWIPALPEPFCRR